MEFSIHIDGEAFLHLWAASEEIPRWEDMMRRAVVLIMVFVAAAFIPGTGTEIDPGFVSGDWYASGNPYNINGEITIHADSTLNIYEGVEVIFQGHFKLIVNGFLEAIGTDTDSILFTAGDISVGWHGIRFINAPDSSHLSYSIIQYGKAIGTDDDGWGGGIHCENSSPVITHCSIRMNWAQVFNGGISLYSDANPTITYSDIIQNSANAEAGVGCKNYCDPVLDHCTIAYNVSNEHTGGMIMDTDCSPIITNCVFANNSANGSSDNGGGVMITDNSHPVITDCGIVDNYSGNHGGGMRISNNSNPVITGCLFSGNTAGSNGGGISCYDASPLIEDCTIRDNYAGSYGGGFHSTGSAAQPELRNCVITRNSASTDGGGMEIVNSIPIIVNCILFDNNAPVNGAQVDCWSGGLALENTIVGGNTTNESIFINTASPNFSYCDFFNSDGPDFDGNIPPDLGVIDTVNANGDSCDIFMNIFLDPLFVDPVSGDFHLMSIECGDQYDSPCIDAGHPAILDSLVDCSWGLGTILSDMGTCGGGAEGPACVYTPGDVNQNGTPLELGDVIAMIGMYRGSVVPPYECPCPPHGDNFSPTADPNGNCLAFELGDVVTEIGAYRGSAQASGCPDCPGSLRLRPTSQGESTVVKRLKSKVRVEDRRVSE